MQEVESVLRMWGRSVGVVIPKKTVAQEGLKPGETVKILIVKKTNAMKKTFGVARLKRSTEEILKEIDEEGWNE